MLEKNKIWDEKVYKEFYKWIRKNSSRKAKSVWSELFGLRNSRYKLKLLKESESLYTEDNTFKQNIQEKIKKEKESIKSAEKEIKNSFIEFISSDCVDIVQDIFEEDRF